MKTQNYNQIRKEEIEMGFEGIAYTLVYETKFAKKHNLRRASYSGLIKALKIFDEIGNKLNNLAGEYCLLGNSELPKTYDDAIILGNYISNKIMKGIVENCSGNLFSSLKKRKRKARK